MPTGQVIGSTNSKGENPKDRPLTPNDLWASVLKHLGIDSFAYLRGALPGLFALGEKPTAEQVLDWLPDRWLLNRTRGQPTRGMTAG